MTNINIAPTFNNTARLISANVTDDKMEFTQLCRQQRRPGDHLILEAAVPPRRDAKVTPDGAILCPPILKVGDVTAVDTWCKIYSDQDTRG